ncbi:probable E3 ubiquitin-protein ligase RNF217 [Panicum hallii]|nr:probable E3 ubiquitin-protein ligase RNF217 [Panicum hallii]
MQEDGAVLKEDGGDRSGLDLDATARDRAMAHALHMEELLQVEDWDLRRFEFEEPPPAGAHGPAAVFHAAPAGQAVNLQFALGQPIFEGTAFVHIDAVGAAVAPPAGGFGMQELAADHAAEGLQFFAAAQANATDNQHAACSPLSGGPGAFNQTARHAQPVGGVESVTIRLSRAADAVISARQAVLGNASSPAVLAGMEEEHDNSWYESILCEAQRMEQMEEPGLYELSLQTLLPSSQQEPCYSSTEGSGFQPSDFDPDEEPGPSTVRVTPLGDDEVPKFNCGICMETLPILDLFHGMQCEHRFCVECMATYIEGRIHAGEVPIPCPDPGCREGEEDNRALHPEVCKKSIDFTAFGNWGYRLTEAAIPASRRAYCPNRQCGVMLETTGGKTPAMAFCPACSHPMCATCGTDWSSEGSGQHDCTEGPSAQLVKKLAEERRWKQCPKCRMLVEKTYGCNVMRCRCHFIFCYSCGLPTGRQTGMEQGAVLCHCYYTVDAAQIHAEWHQPQ